MFFTRYHPLTVFEFLDSSLFVSLPLEVVIKSVVSEAKVSFAAAVELDCGSVTGRSSRNLWTDSVYSVRVSGQRRTEPES